MEDYLDYLDEIDPRRSGVKGLSGINTNNGMERLANENNTWMPTSPSQYKQFGNTQTGNFAQPFQYQDYGEYGVDSKITNISDLQNLNDARGRYQSSLEQIVNGTAKGLVLTGTTIGNTLGTFLVGLPEWFTTGDFSKVYDNEVSRAMDAINKWSEKEMPNFYTQDEQDNPLALRNWFTANTLADKIIKNWGFTIGTMLTGMGTGAAIKAVASGSKIASLVENASGASKAVASLLGSLFGAAGEAAFESKQTQEGFLERYDQQHQLNLAAIEQNYAGTEMYDQLVAAENQRYAKELQDVSPIANKAADADFIANLVILTASNMLQFGRLFARGFNTAESMGGHVAGDMIKGSLKEGYKSTGKKYKGALKAAGNFLTEGSEEISQQYATDASTNYYREYLDNIYAARIDPEAQERQIDLFKSLTETFMDTMTDPTAWEQFIIGGITGVTGVPMVRSLHSTDGALRSPIYMANNAFSVYNDYVKSMNEADQIAAVMNKTLTSPDSKNYIQALIADDAFNEDLDRAAAEQDKYSFANAEHNKLVNIVDAFRRAGRLDDFRKLVENSLSTDDKNLQSIIDNTTKTITKNDGSTELVGPFVTLGHKLDISNEDDKRVIIDELNSQKEKLNKYINDYEKYSKQLDNQPGQNFTDDQRSELIWLHMMLDNFKTRAKQMSKDQILPALEKIKERAEMLEASFKDTIDNEVIDKETRGKYEDSLDKLNNQISFINSIIESKNDDIADLILSESKINFLFKNTKLNKAFNLLGDLRNTLVKNAEALGFDTEDMREAVNALGDLSKMSNVYTRTQEKVREYLKNPSKIDSAREKIRAKATQSVNTIRGNKLRKNLEAATTLAEFREVLNKSKDSEDVKKQVLNDIKSGNTFAKNHLELEEAKEGVLNELAKMTINDALERSDATDLISQAYSEAETADYFLDPRAESYQKTDYIANEPDVDKRNIRHQKGGFWARIALDNYKKEKAKAQSIQNNVPTTAQTAAANPPTSTTGMSTTSNGAGIPGNTKSTSPTTPPTTKSGQSVNLDETPLADTNREIREPIVPGETRNDALNRQLDSDPKLGTDNDRKEDKPTVGYMQGYSSPYNYPGKVIERDDSTGEYNVNEEIYKPNPKFEKLRKFLASGFEYVDSGRLKAGDEVTIGMHEIDGVRYLIAFVKDGDNWIPLNNISGYTDEALLKKNLGLKELYDKINSEYDEFVKDGDNKDKPYISETKTHVAQIYLGKLHLSNSQNNLRDVEKQDGEPLVFGIMTSEGLKFGHLDQKNKDYDEDKGEISPNDETLAPLNQMANVGRVYLTIPNSRRGSVMGRNTIPVIIKKFDKNFETVPHFGAKIKDNIQKLKDAFIAGDRQKIIEALYGSKSDTSIKGLSSYINLSGYDIIYDSKKKQLRFNRIARKSDGTRDRVSDGRPKYQEKKSLWISNTALAIENFEKTLTDKFIKDGVTYNVSLAHLNNKDYNDRLIESGVLYVYAADFTSKGGWFALNPIVNGEEIDATDLPQMGATKSTKSTTTTTKTNPTTKPAANTKSTPVKSTTSGTGNLTFTFNGVNYVSRNGKVYRQDPTGETELKKNLVTANVFKFLEGLQGLHHSYDNGRFIAVKDNNEIVIFDRDEGKIISKNSKEYKEIFAIEYSDNISGTDTNKVATDDVINLLYDGEFLEYTNEDGSVESNYVYKTKYEYKGIPIYVTVRPRYDEEGLSLQTFTPVIIIGNQSISLKELSPQDTFDFDKLSLLNAAENISAGNTNDTIKSQVEAAYSKNTTTSNTDNTNQNQVGSDSASSFEDTGFSFNADGSTASTPATPVDSKRRSRRRIIGSDMQKKGPLNREAVKESYEVFDKQKESEWLERVLPNLSTEERLSFVDGLIPILESGRKAWGQFDGSMMTISNRASKGTIYHEAFHAVFHMLLNDKKRLDIYKAAMGKYGNLDSISLEEALAEDFRRYVTYRENMGLGKKILDFFKSLAIKATNWITHRHDIDRLFMDINDGKYANLKPNSVTNNIGAYDKNNPDIRYRELTESEIQELVNNGHSRDFIKGANEELLNIMKICAGIA